MRCRVPHKRLSSPFPVLALDLQQRVDAIAGAALTHTSLPTTDLMWESDTQLKIHATSDGLWNGVAFWFEVGFSLPFFPFFCWVTGELSTLSVRW